VWSLTDSFDQCSHPLAARVRYVATAGNPNATCAAATRANLQNELGGVATEFGNGPGVLTSGLDYQINYSLPLGPGDFSVGATATQVLTLEDTEVTLDGFELLAGAQRVGELNFAGAATAAPEWSVNAFTSYRMGPHVFRAGASWRSAVVDERAGIQYGENGEDPVYIDLFYLFDITDTLRLSASVENVFDRDPPKHQIEYGYDARLGSALGRTFEIGIKKVF
jgi:outer membrane receptor protein involved in Fe transport